MSERFVGRYDMELEKYSLLPPQHRKGRLQDIDESAFPPAGEKPRVSEMFDPSADGPPNREQLMMPPATMMSPRLEETTWDAFYTDPQGNRTRVDVEFDGRGGSYGDHGQVANVRYVQQANMQMIVSDWSSGGSTPPSSNEPPPGTAYGILASRRQVCRGWCSAKGQGSRGGWEITSI